MDNTVKIVNVNLVAPWAVKGWMLELNTCA